jgi:hypothetical protein
MNLEHCIFRRDKSVRMFGNRKSESKWENKLDKGKTFHNKHGYHSKRKRAKQYLTSLTYSKSDSTDPIDNIEIDDTLDEFEES